MKRNKLPLNFKGVFLFAFIFSLIIFGTRTMAQSGNESESNHSGNTYKVKRKLFKYSNVLSIYPLQVFSSYMSLGYEFKTGEKTAFKTIAGFAQKEGSFLNINNVDGDLTKYSAFKIEMQFKYFINKKATVFNGIYFAPFGMYKACNFNYDTYESGYDPVSGKYYSGYTSKKDKAGAIHAGFIVGYHEKLGDSFTLDVFAGEGLMTASGFYKMGSRLFDPYTNAVRLKLGVNIGFGL